jgi:hypothetical protein
MLLVVMPSLKLDSALSNGGCREIFSKTFYSEGHDNFIVLKDRVVIKDMSIGAGVIVA